MTLASHARGPEFEPRCEYYHFFGFHPQKIQKKNTKVLVMMYDNDRPDAARRGHAGDGKFVEIG